MLQGALFATNNGLMRDDLRQQNFIPLTQPYNANLSGRFTHVGGGNEVTNAAVLAANAGTGDAIVDWVFLEFRDATDNTIVLQTLSALVQRDGDIVDPTDGGNIRVFGLPTQFYVAVKHRNHIGAMMATPETVISGTVTVDFTTATGPDLYNQAGYDGVEQVNYNGIQALWGGNANADRKVKYDGAANDRIVTLQNVLAYPNNTGQTFNYNNAYDYLQGDVNMDGKAKYNGSFNDIIIIQNNVLLYPLNTAPLNNYNNMFEQIPN